MKSECNNVHGERIKTLLLSSRLVMMFRFMVVWQKNSYTVSGRGKE